MTNWMIPVIQVTGMITPKWTQISLMCREDRLLPVQQMEHNKDGNDLSEQDSLLDASHMMPWISYQMLLAQPPNQQNPESIHDELPSWMPWRVPTMNCQAECPGEHPCWTAKLDALGSTHDELPSWMPWRVPTMNCQAGCPGEYPWWTAKLDALESIHDELPSWMPWRVSMMNCQAGCPGEYPWWTGNLDALDSTHDELPSWMP